MEFLCTDYADRVTCVHSIRHADEWEDPPFEGKDYACLLVLGAGAEMPEFYLPLAPALIRTRCRYIVYLGHDSKAWQKETLQVNSRTPEYDTPQEIVFMDNWHDLADPLEEVLYNFYSLCDYDIIIRNFLVLFINADDIARDSILAAIRDRVWML